MAQSVAKAAKVRKSLRYAIYDGAGDAAQAARRVRERITWLEDKMRTK